MHAEIYLHNKNIFWLLIYACSDHSSNTSADFPKHSFPPNTHTCVSVSGTKKCYFLERFYARTKLMIPMQKRNHFQQSTYLMKG